MFRPANLALVVVIGSSCAPAFRDCAQVNPTLLAALPTRLSGTPSYTRLSHRSSDSDLLAPADADGLTPGGMPFTPRFELWSDGATKRRWIDLPPGTRIVSTDPNAWNFPVGTKIWKEFSLAGVRLETRLLFKHGAAPNAWTPMAYVWSSDTEAWAAPDGRTNVRGTSHDVPSASECMACHRGSRSGVLGFSAVQLPERGERDDLGVSTLRETGRLTTPIPRSEIPGDLNTRAALGYLHANCSHCHNQDRGATQRPRCFNPERDFDFTLRVGELESPAATATYRTAIGRVIAPGDPERSDIVQRLRSRDRWWGMPALGSEVIDDDGLHLIETWIRDLLDR
jgi:hypothetical protein